MNARFTGSNIASVKTAISRANIYNPSPMDETMIA